MRKNTLIATLLISTSIVAGGALLAPAFAQQSATMTAAENTRIDAQWLTIPEVLKHLETAGYRDIEEIERESDCYEVKATDRDGRRVEIDVHPISGEVLKTEMKHDRR